MAPGWRNKTTRELAVLIRAAGGTVETAGKNRIRVTGPAGTVVLMAPGRSTGALRHLGNVTSLIRRRTGLDVDL